MKRQYSLNIRHLNSLLLLAFIVLVSSACSRSEEETAKTTTAPVKAEPVQTVQSDQIPITTCLLYTSDAADD